MTAREQQNALWDVLSEIFGEPRTRPEQTRRGLVVRELRYADATPDEVRVTWAYCKRHFPKSTEMALLNHLTAAMKAQAEAPASTLQDVLDRIVR